MGDPLSESMLLLKRGERPFFLLYYLDSDIHIWCDRVIKQFVHVLVGGLRGLGHLRRVGRQYHLLLLVLQQSPFRRLLLPQHAL